MHIAVLIKQVPDSDEVKIDHEKGTMIRDGLGNIVNPLDLNALEEALKLRTKHGGDVTVITMGPSHAEIALRETLSLGADKAFLLSDRFFAGSDTWATALILSKALQKLGYFDLILAGEKATDGETGQVGPEVASMLDIPFATYVSALTFEGTSFHVQRTIEDGYQHQQIQIPCLLTLLNDINIPGMPTLHGKKRARRAEIQNLDKDDLGLSKDQIGITGSPTKVVKIESPKITRQTAFFSGKEIDTGLDAIIAILKSLAVI